MSTGAAPASLEARLDDRQQGQVGSAAEPSIPARRRRGFGAAYRDAYNKRVQQQQIQGDGWVQRKFAVGIVIAAFAYSTYAFVVRVCAPMVRNQDNRQGSQAQGIVYLVFWSILWLMFVWTYLMVAITRPGDVKQLLPKAPEPEEPAVTRRRREEGDSDVTVAGHPYEGHADPAEAAAESGTKAAAVNPALAVASTSGEKDPPEHTKSIRPPPEERQIYAGEETIDESRLEREMPDVPILDPYFRYCTRCERVKPYRTHHCRHCATCVLKMDHHCPWVGHCVGAGNYRYFVQFVFWAALYTSFVFLAGLFALVPPNRPDGTSRSFDGQELALVIEGGLFAFFTWGMFLSHAPLVLTNTTTLEHMGRQRTKHRDEVQLARQFEFMDCRSRADVRKQWKADWGKPTTEGNLWYLGSARANVEAAMGKSVLGWFFPIPTTGLSDGLNYPVNPRFAPNGIPRKRQEWPTELQ